MKIQERIDGDFTDDVIRFAYLKDKYFNGRNGEVEAKIGWIDELIDILLFDHLVSALNKTDGIKLSPAKTSTPSPDQTSIQNLASELIQNKNSFIHYIYKKTKEYILKIALVELTFAFDYLTSDTILKENAERKNIKTTAPKKDSNITEIYCKYIDIMNGKTHSFDKKKTRDSNTDLIKALRTPKNAAYKSYSLPQPILECPEFFMEIAHSAEEPYIQAIIAFMEDYHGTFSFGEYASKDFVFLQWTNKNYAFWFPPSFPLYLGYLFDNFRGKKTIYWHCQDYKKKLADNKKFDWGEKFNTIIKSYDRLSTSAQAGLSTYKQIAGHDSAAYLCNEFLINNFLHRDFFSSLDSDLFNSLASRCVLSTLLSYKTRDGISDVMRTSIFFYELLRHMFIFDININHLEKTDFSINDISSLTTIDEESSMPLQLIYDFLHEIYLHFGFYLNEIHNAYTRINFNRERLEIMFQKKYSSPAKAYSAAVKAYARILERDENPPSEISYKNKILLASFSKFVSKFSTTEYASHRLYYDASDKEQAGLQIHLLHYPACNGTLIWDKNIIKKWHDPNI